MVNSIIIYLEKLWIPWRLPYWENKAFASWNPILSSLSSMFFHTSNSIFKLLVAAKDKLSLPLWCILSWPGARNHINICQNWQLGQFRRSFVYKIRGEIYKTVNCINICLNLGQLKDHLFMLSFITASIPKYKFGECRRNGDKTLGRTNIQRGNVIRLSNFHQDYQKA